MTVVERCQCGVNDHDHAVCQAAHPVAVVTEPLAEYAVCSPCLTAWRARWWVTGHGPPGYSWRPLEPESSPAVASNPAWELRRQGRSYDEIAAALGCTRGEAFDMCRAALSG